MYFRSLFLLALALPKSSRSMAPLPRCPNECTYWVLPNQLLAGEYPSDYISENTPSKLRQYLDCGITYFVDLTQEGERQDYVPILKQEAEKIGLDVMHKRLSIPDFGIPSPALMMSILNTIDEGLNQGLKVYVHCRGGIGRTGTVVACFLVQNQGLSGNAALLKTNELFQASARSRESDFSPETSAQMDFVRRWSDAKKA